LNSQVKLLAALAAALVVAVAGYSLLPKSGIGGPPTPTALETPIPVATQAATPSGSAGAYVCEEGTGCAGALAAGDGHTAQFSVPFTFTVPAGWANPIDLPTLFALTPVDQPADLILVWSGAVPAQATAECTLQAEPGAQSTVSGWMSFLESNPGIDATNPQTLSIARHPTKSIDVRAHIGWSSPCTTDRADLNFPLLKLPDGAPRLGYGVHTGTRVRVYAINVAGQSLIVTVTSSGTTDADFAAATGRATPVVESFFFATP